MSEQGDNQENPLNPENLKKGRSKQPRFSSQIEPGKKSQKRQFISQIPQISSQIPRKQDQETEEDG